jgi:hypothetical protein
MRQTGGGSWVCLALLGLGACSSPSPPPAEGSVQITWSNGCSLSPASITGPGGLPSGKKVGANQTVLDGRDGYKVSCTVSRSGGGYSVSATLELPDNIMLTVDANSVSTTGGKATMSFYSPGSINTFNSPLEGCTLTTTSSTTGLTIMPGSIWATYSCPGVADTNNLGKVCDTSGVIVFTGCNK